jgi:peptidoglycan-N-acetylglucosamine deacetylase
VAGANKYDTGSAMIFTTSWDDGHPLDQKLANLLAKHGMAGTFFCPITNAEQRPVMSPQALRALQGPAFEIGSHTLDHRYASRTSGQDWQAQVVRGKAALEDSLGHVVQGFCYPGGELSASAKRTVIEAGFSYGRTTENFRLDCGNDPFLVPTTVQFYPHSRAVIARNWLRKGKWSLRFRMALGLGGQTQLLPRLQTALAQAQQDPTAVFHLWGHSWELEEHALWSELDRFLATVAAVVPLQQRCTNQQTLVRLGILSA